MQGPNASSPRPLRQPRTALGRKWDRFERKRPYGSAVAFGLFLAFWAAVLGALFGEPVQENVPMIVFWGVAGFFITIGGRVTRRWHQR